MVEKTQQTASDITRDITSGHGRGLKSWLIYASENNVREWLETSVDAFIQQLRGCQFLDEIQRVIALFFAECCQRDPQRWDHYFGGLIAPIENPIADKGAERNQMHQLLTASARRAINEAIQAIGEGHLAEMQSGRDVQSYGQFCERFLPYSQCYPGESPPSLNKKYETRHRGAFVEGVQRCAENHEYAAGVQQAVVHGFTIEPLHLKELIRLGYERSTALQVMGLDEGYLKQAHHVQGLIENLYAYCDARSPLSSEHLCRNMPDDRASQENAAIFTETAGELVTAFSQLARLFPQNASRVHMLVCKRILSLLQSRAQHTYNLDEKIVTANDYLPNGAKETVKDIAKAKPPAEFLTDEEQRMSFRERIGAYTVRMNIGRGGTELDRFESDFDREFLDELWRAMESSLMGGDRRELGEMIRRFLNSVLQSVEGDPDMTSRVQNILGRLLGNASRMAGEDFVDDFVEQFFVQQTNQAWSDISSIMTKYLPFSALQHYKNGNWDSDDIDELFGISWGNTLPHDSGDSVEGASVRSFIAIPDTSNFLLTEIVKKRYPEVEKGPEE